MSATDLTPEELAGNVSQRRTFAIISHPDAGKTTLTEKLLLYSGMIRTAGVVRARKGNRSASSDWMAMEQERGISITASAMQFRYKSVLINVLDTPGHQDFSEDTYRTLTAADCAIMVIDSVKGVEPQTRRLFAVCRVRGIPVITFINKMDLAGKDPLALTAEVEEVLGIESSPLNWPIGSGKEFAGVVDLTAGDKLHLFSRAAAGGSTQAEEVTATWEDLDTEGGVRLPTPPRAVSQARMEVELLKDAGNPFSREKFLRGEQTPIFFGSAITNFGVELLFDALVSLAPEPRPREARTAEGTPVEVQPASPDFSGYVFKVQANMNPRHRDSMAFFRVCSGAFERDMVVKHHRTGKPVRLAFSHSMIANERSTLNQAFAGDIVGVVNSGMFAIGDTLSTSGGFDFPLLPRFPPEVIAQIRPTNVGKRKSFDKGMEQLSQEGTVQVLRSFENPHADLLVAAVGKLQFDVLQYRLREEYSVETILDTLPYAYGAWLMGDPKTFKKTLNSLIAVDMRGQPIVLFRSEWEKRYSQEQNPEHQLLEFV